MCLDLVAEEQRPADVYRVKTAVALQHDGERYHTLSGLQGQRQDREAGFCLRFEADPKNMSIKSQESLCVFTRSQSASCSSFRVLFTCSMLARCMAPLFSILFPDSPRESKVLLY